MAGDIDRKKLKKSMKAQGWLAQVTKEGFFAIPPHVGEKVLWHDTPSDWRADKNAIAMMKRQGFIWPYEKKAEKAKQKGESGRGETA